MGTTPAPTPTRTGSTGRFGDPDNGAQRGGARKERFSKIKTKTLIMMCRVLLVLLGLLGAASGTFLGPMSRGARPLARFYQPQPQLARPPAKGCRVVSRDSLFSLFLSTDAPSEWRPH